MSCFVDTSAIIAVLDRNDRNHARARSAWNELLDAREVLVSSNYVVLESSALIQSRFGMEAFRHFHEDVFPLFTLQWVDAQMHLAGVQSALTASRRELSLVDCISFEIMRRKGVQRAFAFDRHFPEQGFQCIPA